MTDSQLRSEVTRSAREQARRSARTALWTVLPALLFIALGVVMIRSGRADAAVAGWLILAVFCPGLLVFVPLFGRDFRRLRWISGDLIGRWQVLDALLMVLATADFAGLFGWMAWHAEGLGRAFAALIAAGFSLMALIFLRRAFDRNPVVVVNDVGYFDRRYMRKPIAWGQVEGFSSRHDLCLVAREQNSNRRLIARLNASLGQPGYSINPLLIDCCIGDVLLAIRHHAPWLYQPKIEA